MRRSGTVLGTNPHRHTLAVALESWVTHEGGSETCLPSVDPYGDNTVEVNTDICNYGAFEQALLDHVSAGEALTLDWWHDYPAGTSVWLHVHNHVANTYNFGVLSR